MKVYSATIINRSLKGETHESDGVRHDGRFHHSINRRKWYQPEQPVECNHASGSHGRHGRYLCIVLQSPTQTCEGRLKGQSELLACTNPHIMSMGVMTRKGK